MLTIQPLSPLSLVSKFRTMSSVRRFERVVAAAALLCTLTVASTGCGLGTFDIASTSTSTLPPVSGQVHGGQQPVSGATIQLYAANTATAMGASTALISSTVHTDANGNFSITGGYTCPAPGALVYIVATGGNPGLTGTINNTAIALATVLGTCGTLTSSTFISINELTTVAAIQALTPFMLDYAHIGASAANVAGLSVAFSNAVAFVDPGSGHLRGSNSSGAVASTALLNTLADIVAACVNSSGGHASDGTACGKLLQYTSTSTDTIAALLSIQRTPQVNASSLFALVTANSPFQPGLSSAPTSFVAPVDLALPQPSYDHSGDQVLADSRGHLWLLQPTVGTLSQYDTALNLLHTFSVGTLAAGGTATHMVLDPQDNLWVPYGLALLKIDSNGNIVSPPTGYPLNQTGITLNSGPVAIFASDAYGNIWYLLSRSSDSSYCLVEYSNTGALISAATGYCGSQKAGAGSGPERAFADTLGNVYLLFGGAYASTPFEVFHSSGSYTDYATQAYGIYGYIDGIFDPKYQRVWTRNGFLYNLNLDGTVNFKDPLSNFSLLGLFEGNLAVDGAGNLWAGTQFGPAEFSPTGTGLMGCSFANSCTTYDSLYGGYVASIAVDPAGDVFILFSQGPALEKLTGIAGVR